MVRNPERIVIGLVKTGEISINRFGEIWRHKIKIGKNIIDIEKRRAEHATGIGYLQVRALLSGKRYHASAHRLVWQFFNGDIPDDQTINHKNGVRYDNRLNNLEIISYSENIKHAYANGFKSQWGEKNPLSKTSNKEVEEIRKRYAIGGITQKELGKIYGLTFQTISKIVRGDRYPKQGGPIRDYSSRKQHNKIIRDKENGRFKAAGRLLDGREWSEMPK